MFNTLNYSRKIDIFVNLPVPAQLIPCFRFFITLTVMRQSRFCANISVTMGNGAFVFFSLIDDFNFLFGSLNLCCEVLWTKWHVVMLSLHQIIYKMCYAKY